MALPLPISRDTFHRLNAEHWERKCVESEREARLIQTPTGWIDPKEHRPQN